MKDINVATNIKNSLSLIKIKLESDICGMGGWIWELVLKRERNEPKSPLGFS